MSELFVTMQDARACGLCVRGVKAWFDQTGRDFRYFLAHGMPASEAEKIDNAFVIKALEQARKRAGETQ